MSNLILSFLLFSLCCAQYAVAGDKVGNGGFIIECPEQAVALDYFEAARVGKKISSVSGNKLDEKVHNLLNKLATLDPDRASSYRELYNKKWKTGLTLVTAEGLHLTAEQVDDFKTQQRYGIGPTQIPQTCRLVLAAEQIKPDVKFLKSAEFKVRIYEPVWNRIDTDQQAFLVIHELFYREFLLRYSWQEFPSSKVSRFLTGLLISDQFLSLSLDEWKNILKLFGFSDIRNSHGNTSSEFDLPYYTEDLDLLFKLDRTITYKTVNEFTLGHLNQGPIGLKYSDTFPRYLRFFNVSEFAIFDISKYSKFPLVITLTKSCSLLSLFGDYRNPQRVGLSQADQCFLQSYLNPNFKFSGPIRVLYVNNSRPLLKVTIESNFSTIEYFNGKTWTKFNSVIIDLKKGTVLDFPDEFKVLDYR